MRNIFIYECFCSFAQKKETVLKHYTFNLAKSFNKVVIGLFWKLFPLFSGWFDALHWLILPKLTRLNRERLSLVDFRESSGGAYTNLSKDCFRSAMMSSTFSKPTDRRIKPSLMPLAALSSGVYGEWVMLAGC